MEFALISNKHVAPSPNKSKKVDELKDKMTNNMGKVGRRGAIIIVHHHSPRNRKLWK